MTLHFIWQIIFALLAGMLLTLAFAPFSFYPAAVISTAILLYLFLNQTPKRSFLIGFIFGVGLFSTSVYWAFICIHTYSNASALFATLITALFVAILSLYPGLTGYFLNRFFANNNSAKLLAAYPAIWILLEWVRSWIFSGFPWLIIGYSQINSPLKGYAPLLSVYGVSLAVLLSAGLLVQSFIQFNNKKIRFSAWSTIIFIWCVGGFFSLISWTQPYSEPQKVSLVQGNIAQELKWSPEYAQTTLKHYQELTRPHWDSQIIIWPESAIPIPFQYATDYIDGLTQEANNHHATLITGIPFKSSEGTSFYNGVIALGNGVGIYTKRRLVPFGEFIPLRSVFGKIFDLLNVPMSDFISSGNYVAKPLVANGMNIATYICYEIAFPEQVLSKDSSINAILTVSNDAWFGKSNAQAQHLEMAQMRALEMGRPVIFVSNDGITAVINSLGQIQSTIPAHQSGVLTDYVQMQEGKTPFQYVGMDPILSILLFLLFVARKRKNQGIFQLSPTRI